MTGVAWAAATTAQASPGHSFAKLSPGQVKALSSGKRERMVVVFDDQLTNLPANPAHRHDREATAASMQAPLESMTYEARLGKMTYFEPVACWP